MAVCCARRILVAATICMALVIWAVFLTDLMRRRMSRRLAMGVGKEESQKEKVKSRSSFSCFTFSFPLLPFYFLGVGFGKLANGGFQLGGDAVVEGALFAELGEDFVLPGRQEIGELGLEILDLVDGNFIEEIILHRPEDGGLEFDGD